MKRTLEREMGRWPIFYVGAFLLRHVVYQRATGHNNEQMQTLYKLTEMLEPTIESMGYELIHLEFSGSTLRIYIDAPGGIEVDDCALVSRQVSAIMDVEDPVKNAYSLEVSSPGLDRPLVKPAHFQRFTGELAKIVMHTHVLGRRRFTGVLVEANEELVVLEADGESYDLPYELMESARLEPVFETRRS